MELQTYVATVMRNPNMEAETFHIFGTDKNEAASRLTRVAKISNSQIVELVCSPSPATDE